MQKGKRFDSRDGSAREAQEKSTEAQNKRRTLKEGLLLLLNEKDEEGKTTQDAIIAGFINRAISGDPRTIELLLRIIGESPEGNTTQEQTLQKAKALIDSIPDRKKQGNDSKIYPQPAARRYYGRPVVVQGVS